MKIRLLLFFLLTVSTKLLGQIGFEEQIVVGESFTTIRPQSVKAADIDGDNDLDIVAYGMGLNWYENIDGQGNFGERNIVAQPTSGPVGHELHTSDFDNDGDIDILGCINNRFTLYKNTDGSGSYEVAQFFDLGPSYNKLCVVPLDVNSDGNMDIVCFYLSNFSGPSQGKLVWYENDGLGSLMPQQIISSNNTHIVGASLIYTEDLDGDNHKDIILGYNYMNKISWFKNIDGTGAFDNPITVTLLANEVKSVYTSDIDNDGDMDIISASETDGQIAWYTNTDGLGNFSDENIIMSNITETKAVLVSDINNDNTNDIIYAKQNEVGWLNNTTGLGNFGSNQIITTTAFDVKSIIVADLDGDGKKDIISASEDDDKVAWYKNIDGNGNFGRQLVISRRSKSPNNVYPGDFDGDNDIDLLVNSQHDAKLTWFENVNGLGFYGKQHIITENTESGNITPIAYPVDVDNDGDLDIASVQDSKLFWYKNDGEGNFPIKHTIDNTSPDVTLIRAKDIDGDGDMDLVCGVYNSNKISRYKNLGNGTFGSEQIIYNPGGNNGSLTSLELADLDEDNDIDIIASSFNTGIFYYKNTNGLGSFTNQIMYVFDSMYSVYPADMDGDGDNDIIAVSASGGGAFDAVVWYENSGGGVFETQHAISTLTISGRSIHAADMDGDGDMDVLTAGSHGTGQLAWYKNNGSGVFSPRTILYDIPNSNFGMHVVTADVDNDNDNDIMAIISNNGSNYGDVSVFENLGVLGNTISGKVLIDTNANGCTNDDIKGNNLMVISNNGTNSFATFTDEEGAFSLATTAGNFNTSITSQLPNYFISAPTSHTSNFSGLNNTYLANFCITPMGQVNELIIEAYPSLNDLRPGFDTNYHIVYKNMGTTILSGTIDFEYNNNKINFLTASQTVASQTPNKLTFDFANLNPLETRTIDLEFNVFAPPTTNIDDEVVSIVTINPVLEDETEEDNSFTLNQTVIGSYDPNDITCLEGNQVLIEDADKFLHYLIRFQNTGNASAINVRVENTLDDKLDWTSMQLESMSHNGRVEIKDGNEIKFILDNIYLPDSITNEPHSHGFIAYKIKPLDNVVVGDIVNNTADIYFDFNPPIVTNIASTQFVETLSIVEMDANQFAIYPNPSSNLLNIKGNTMIDKVSLIDLNGRILKEFNFNTQTLHAQLDLTDLTNGIYFLEIKFDQGNTIKKIIKK